MGSAVKNGFSTLNRLLGKKNKNSAMSKSTSNLSKSTTNLQDTSSQFNKIVPLTAMQNAPFEQTFRITVCLPRDQLYVTRVGAKTRLDTLLLMVCENKNLDKDKYEFRHPGDNSQVFGNHLTIGEVGLNEIRMALITDSRVNYDKFNTDEIMKMRPNGRSSFSSSSDFSHNNNHTITNNNNHAQINNNSSSISAINNRHYMKTTSPYSSTNSLNSVDSSGVSSSSRGGCHPPAIPMRKKRAAPRPPSQNSIPEQNQAAPVVTAAPNGSNRGNEEHVFKAPLPRMNFHVSSPNLAQYGHFQKRDFHDSSNSVAASVATSPTVETLPRSNVTHSKLARPMSMHITKVTEVEQPPNGLNGSNKVASMVNISHSRTSSESSEIRDGGPEPIPRRRLVQPRKKAAPSPPPRTYMTPVAPPRTILMAPSEEDDSQLRQDQQPVALNRHVNNVSKVMLNVETTDTSDYIKNDEPEIMSVSPTSEIGDSLPSSDVPNAEHEDFQDDFKNMSPINGHRSGDGSRDSTPISDNNRHLTALNENMSSPPLNSRQPHLVPHVEIIENRANRSPTKPRPPILETFANDGQPGSRSESPLWTYELPAPPNFADNSDIDSMKRHNDSDTQTTNGSTNSTDLSDIPIKPIINQRLPLDFHAFTDSSTMADNESLTSLEIENTYKDSKDVLLRDLEKRREKFIEDEFKFLPSDEDTSSIEESVPIKIDHHQIYTEDLNKHTNETSKIPTPPRMPDPEFVVPTKQPVSKQNSTESVKSLRQGVLQELTDVMSNKRAEPIKKQPEEPVQIEAVKRSSLTNFKIQTYSSSEHEKTESEEEDGARRRSSVDTSRIEYKKVSTDNSTQHRRSLTLSNGVAAYLLKAPNNINRSDSFHSIAHEQNNGLAPAKRSTSYVSLIGAQKLENQRTLQSLSSNTFSDTNRRKSSSELSIGDSPSLQSLVVMKSILGSSIKSGLNEENMENLGKSDVTVPLVKIVDATKKQHNNYINEEDSSKENSPQNTMVKASHIIHTNNNNNTSNSNQSNNEDKLKEQKDNSQKKSTWRYTGPPAVNMGTWSERPKVQVCIKSDRDYKSGSSGKVEGAAEQEQYKDITHKNEVPDIVKVEAPQPVRLPIVRAVEYKKNIPNVVDSSNDVIKLRNYEVSTIVTEKPFSEAAVVMPSSQVASSTIGRVNIVNRFQNQQQNQRQTMHTSKFQPVVRGFREPQNDHENTATSTSETLSSAMKPNTINVEPMTSATATSQTNVPNKVISLKPRPHSSFIPPPVTTPDEQTIGAPFSQNTLRRTGFKEKMLEVASDKQTLPPTSAGHQQSTSMRTIQLKPATVPNSFKREIVTSPAAAVVAAPTPMQRVLAEIKATNVPPPPPPPSSAAMTQVTSISTTQLNGVSSIPIPPPPKMAPVVKAVVAKRTLPPLQVEPRDQLLDSIKNFNKEKLKKKRQSRFIRDD